jgi:hypothetical protein
MGPGDDHSAGAVLVFDFEPQNRFGKTEITRALGARGVESAVAEDQPDGVLAGGELTRDVEGDVERALIVIGEAGREYVVADLGAVEKKL